MNFFQANDEKQIDLLVKLHNEIEQLERQEKISSFSIKSKKSKLMIDYNFQTMKTTKGKESKEFDVSLEECTCEDFISRQKPCKHMYRLAKELGLYKKIDERSRNLIADFSKGYADSWKFIVRPCNYSDLDIVYSNLLSAGEKKGKNSKKDLVLTQGKLYKFFSGEVFYDSYIPYTECLTWKNALEQLDYKLNILQIDYATDSSPMQEVIFQDNKFINQSSPIYGKVEFSHFKIIDRNTDWEKVKKYSCTQDEFVKLLKTGEFCDSDGKIQKIC